MAAIPMYFGTMGAEYRWLRRRAEREGPSPVDYERNDTIASLTMGVGSLVAPLVLPRLLAPVTPGKGRFAKALVGFAAGAAAVTTLADVIARRVDEIERVDETGRGEEPHRNRTRRGQIRTYVTRRRIGRLARKVASVGGVAAVVAGGVAATAAWTELTSPERLWKKRVVRDLGTGPLAMTVAVLTWDFIYYWNHRFMHESRYMWAIHDVHHSSQRYNLSTALRQPVADAFGTYVPQGLACLVGVRPELVTTARGINLIYQYWIHTDAIRRLGPAEKIFNTPSHHRVHHGANSQYIDRNHGSIFIVWDRLFGTFEPEDEPVVYGLTRNIDSFNPVVIATHEHVDMLADVARATTWRDRLSHVLRGPGWSYARRAERAGSPGDHSYLAPISRSTGRIASAIAIDGSSGA